MCCSKSQWSNRDKLHFNQWYYHTNQTVNYDIANSYLYYVVYGLKQEPLKQTEPATPNQTIFTLTYQTAKMLAHPLVGTLKGPIYTSTTEMHANLRKRTKKSIHP